MSQIMYTIVIFQSKVMVFFLFGLCVMRVPFCSPTQPNNSRRIVQVVKLLTIYLMFLRSRNYFRHCVRSSVVDLSGRIMEEYL